MNRVLFQILVIIFFFSCFCYSQNNYYDVVYLKNGSIIQGIIVEQAPNKYIKIQTFDKNLWVFKMDDIEKISKKMFTQNRKTADRSQYSVLRDGYFSCERIGVMAGDGNTAFAIGSINGGWITQNFSMGFGVEYNNFSNGTLIPLYLDMRVNYLNTPVTPLSYIDIGYSLGWIKGLSGMHGDGFMISVGSGVEFNLNSDFAMRLDLSWRKQWTEIYYIDYYYDYFEFFNIDLDYFNFMIGFSF